VKSNAPATLGIAVVIVCATVCSLGDRLPKSKLAQGKEETKLAGVKVYETSIQQVLHRFGKPTQQREVFPATQDVAGERQYMWRKRNVTLTIETQFLPKSGEYVSSIIVEGTDGTLGKTGRGLRLGDDYRAVRRIYGDHYARNGRHISVQWKTTTTLEVGWNKRGVINRMELLGPE
jgi:hypothetical protein